MMVSLSQFWDMLDTHDWHYCYSDDRSKYSAGKSQESAIKMVLQHRCLDKAYQGLYDTFHKIAWSNPGERPDKPERPSE